MRRIFVMLFIVTLLVVACDNKNNEFYEETTSTIRVDIEVTDIATSRASYQPDEEIYVFSWDANDKIQIRIPDTENDDTDGYDSGGIEFTTEDGGENASFTGELIPWSGEKIVYALSEYGYTPDITERNGIDVLVVNNSTMMVQTGSSSRTINQYNTGLLVAKAEGATLVSEDDYYFPALYFKQIYSFIQIQINDIPDDVNIYDVVLDSGDPANTLFPDEVYISMETAEIVDYTEYMRGELFWGVSDFNRENNIITIPILPVDARAYQLTLGIKTSENLTCNLTDGVNFERNKIYFKELSYNDFKSEDHNDSEDNLFVAESEDLGVGVW